MTESILPIAPPTFSGAALEWLRALPSKPDRADLYALNEDDFAVRCVHELIEGRTFDLPVQANHIAGEWFNHFYFEARNRERVFGTKNLGIGYPFILTRLGGYDVAAPLFVWQCQLEPNPQHADQWQIQRLDGQNTLPNYPFFHLVDALNGTNFSERARTLCETKSLTPRALTELCEGLRLMLGLQEEGLPLSVQPMPTEDVAGTLLDTGCLHWSAVGGIFPTLPRTVLSQAPVVAPNLTADADWKHQFTLLPLDPSQRSALHAVQHNALTVIEGASGTGKTYLISAILINALSNGKKCLVVSKSINALRRAQKFVLDKGFGDVSFVLRDTAGDKLMLADMLRAAADSKHKASYDVELYKATLNKTQREQNQLDAAWAELHTPIFGDLNFTDTVGRFLRSNRTQGKELLLSQLHPADFVFSKKEYDDIVAAIYASEPLFRRFPTLSHPLGRLNSAIFTQFGSEEGLANTEALVQQLLQKATALHHGYIAQTNDYTEALFDHYEQYNFELSNQIKQINDGLEDGVQRFGPDFEKPISASEKLYGVFSDRYKQVVAAKEKIGVLFEDMRRIYSARRYFEFDFPPHFDNRNIRKIAELTRSFSDALQLWHKRTPATVREDVRRMNAKSIHPDLDFRDDVRKIEQDLDVFVDEFNAAGLYDDTLKHEMLTIPKRQEFLEDVIARLEDTRFYLRDFDDFYIWQKHWLGLYPSAQKVVRALCKIKPVNWLAAFESWYLYHFLQKNFSPGMQWNPGSIANLNESARSLRNLLPLQISALWEGRKHRALKTLKSDNATAYKTWFGKNNRDLSANQRADDLFRDYIFPLTETLPVLLVTPEVALDVVQASNMLFDVILVDEAHNIAKQECYHLFDMAKNLVILGDSKQDMTPFAEDDILEFCKGIGAKTHLLEYQHQDSPEEWVRFNKIAFDTPFKRLPSGRSALEATIVANVEGRYDEDTKTNEAEARQIIDWLNLIEPTPAKTYPVVGIACATVQQRDLIAGQLLKIRQRRMVGHEKIQQLHLNGLGVYQFGELQGQHVDVLLMSLTHGMNDARGTLTRDLHFWNSQLGFNQLHVALTRATQKIYIAHSIPPGLHAALAADKNFLGTCVLSHLVTFADLIQRGEQAAAEEQLQNMKLLLGANDFYYPSSTFKDEVALALTTFYKSGNLLQNVVVAGGRVPMYVQSTIPDEPSSVLLFDGVLAPTQLPSYEWEEKLRHYFQNKGIGYVPTYAVNWWKSPKQEARRLVGRLSRKEEF